MEFWEGSEFTGRRGPRRSLTDCFKDVAGGCCENKDYTTLDLSNSEETTSSTFDFFLIYGAKRHYYDAWGYFQQRAPILFPTT